MPSIIRLNEYTRDLRISRRAFRRKNAENRKVITKVNYIRRLKVSNRC